MLATVERIENAQLPDRVAIYARGNILLYENTLRDGEWSQTPAARLAVEAERDRPWTPEEKVSYAQDWDRVLDQMRQRNAPAAEPD